MAVRVNKYNNKKVIGLDGIEFDSKKESRRYFDLKMMERAGIISNLKTQVPYILFPKSEYGREMKYIADFVYFNKEKNITVVEDTKGYKTQVYKIKKRILQELYGITIKET